MVLIGVELIEVMKDYLTENTLHVEVVFLVAMIAVARKVIVLDYKVTSPQTLYGTAAIIVALCGGFYLLKKALRRDIRVTRVLRNLDIASSFPLTFDTLRSLLRRFSPDPAGHSRHSFLWFLPSPGRSAALP